MLIEVVRSPRRRKTVELRPARGAKSLRLVTPIDMSGAEEREHLAALFIRWRRRRARPPVDIEQRALELAATYRLPTANLVEWVTNQTTRWGSCTRATRHIRVSSMLGGYPQWVIDYVLVHELAHLVEVGHPPRFWELVNRYPLTERARGFLIAKGLEESAL